MNNLSQDEEKGVTQIAFAMTIGFVAGMLLGFLAGYWAADAFANCEINRNNLSTTCEANRTVGIVYGVGIFAAVMLQAYVVGTILQTNTLVKGLVRVATHKGSVSQLMESTDDAEWMPDEIDTEYQKDAEDNSEISSDPKSRPARGLWSLRVLSIVQLPIVLAVATGVLIGEDADPWLRIIYGIQHPIAAVAIVVLMFMKRPADGAVILVAILVAVNLLSDLIQALSGADSGILWRPIIFNFIPIIAMIYLRIQRPSLRSPTDNEGGVE